MGRWPLDLTGHRFGKLVAHHKLAQDENKAWYWFCTCDCGGTTHVKASTLVRKEIVSCGCNRGAREHFFTPIETRLLRNCIPEPNSGCWLWTGKAQVRGYGTMGTGGRGSRTELAHRISYKLYKGAIPKGKVICHKCDNSWCVNPDHLYAGTRAENLFDDYHQGPTNRYGFARIKQGERHGF